MAGGAKTTAGPSVMGPAGQQDGPLPGGPTQTAAGRPPRTEPRGANEVELDLLTMLAVKRDVRERMAAAKPTDWRPFGSSLLAREPRTSDS